jgi:hypothetical protein
LQLLEAMISNTHNLVSNLYVVLREQLQILLLDMQADAMRIDAPKQA